MNSNSNPFKVTKMYSNLTYSKLKVNPLWVGGFSEGHLQAEANTILGRTWLDFYMGTDNNWEVAVNDGDDQCYLTTVYCKTYDVLGLIMYVQVNETDWEDEKNPVYRGKVYSLDDDREVCEFTWTLTEGTVYTSTHRRRGNEMAHRAIEDFIDERCYEIYNGER